ncbi:MAG: HIT domain-containing protein [Saprospiraceae bacterium]
MRFSYRRSGGLLVSISLLVCFSLSAQSKEYQEKKKQKLERPSPFERVIAESKERPLEYEDDFIAVFKPLSNQAEVHFIIVPKKRIPTINDLEDEEAFLIGKMVVAAKDIANKYGISESGYRLVINTNEDAGQSVFHIHMHLLGGNALGPMVDQTWRNKQEKNNH